MLEEKFKHLKLEFSKFPSKEEVYSHIMSKRHDLPSFPKEQMTQNNLVLGCTSTMFLIATNDNNKIKFNAYSDALISAGLAAIMIYIYNDESPETIIKHPPSILSEIGIIESLSPTRVNGLVALYNEMRKLSVKFLL